MTTIDKTFAGMRKFHVRRFAKMFFQWVLLLTEGLYAYKCDLHCEGEILFVWFATNWQTYQHSAAGKCLFGF